MSLRICCLEKRYQFFSRLFAYYFFYHCFSFFRCHAVLIIRCCGKGSKLTKYRTHQKRNLCCFFTESVALRCSCIKCIRMGCAAHIFSFFFKFRSDSFINFREPLIRNIFQILYFFRSQLSHHGNRQFFTTSCTVFQ